MHDTPHNQPHSPPVRPTVDKDTSRLESFSDGVFSIAMTLLVLELQVPPVPAHPTAAALCAALGQRWPSYFAFVTSFATVLIMWVNHHGIFKLIRRSDASILFTNGFLLLMVTVVPFPTALVATYLRTPAASAACAVYAWSFVITNIAYTLVLLAARRGGDRLLMPNSMGEVNHRLRGSYCVGLPLYILAAIAAPFSPWLCLEICSVLWLYWTYLSMQAGRAFSA